MDLFSNAGVWKKISFSVQEGPDDRHQPGGLGWSPVQSLGSGTWSPQERPLAINFLEFRLIRLGMLHCSIHLKSLPVRVQSDNATVAVYINQEGNRSQGAQKEVYRTLSWAEMHVPALFVVPISDVEFWQAEFLMSVTVPGEWDF